MYALDAAVLGYTSGPLGFCWPGSQISFSFILVAYSCKVKALSNEQFNNSILFAMKRNPFFSVWM